MGACEVLGRETTKPAKDFNREMHAMSRGFAQRCLEMLAKLNIPPLFSCNCTAKYNPHLAMRCTDLADFPAIA
jgi:hypothetical protein